MLLRMLYDDKLAQASYLLACQRSGEALIVDPQRDVDRYLDLAAREGVSITAIAETHIHADYLSGARELAERTGAKLHVSGCGGEDWQYRWLDSFSGGGSYDAMRVRDGDAFTIGGISLRVMHTPGHTPEHVCFLVTDKGGGATEPMGVFTGDFVFVGDLGRPDLLETAAGTVGAKEPSARQLFVSVKRFLELADYVQVWPAHGSGSACGKALGAVAQSTVGYERRFNPAIRVAGEGESAFVAAILEGQPEPPLYFARMKRENRDGPAVLGELPRPSEMSARDLAGLDAKACAIIDTRSWREFKQGHLPGSLYLPLNSSFPTDAGSFVRGGEPIYLILDGSRVEEGVRDLVRIGLDDVRGWCSPASLKAYAGGGGTMATSRDVDVREAAAYVRESGAFVLDVRRASEHAQGTLPGAKNIAHTRLAAHLTELPKDRPILVHCQAGGRSARAVALLRREGFDAVNLANGYAGWMAVNG